ncbi:hypothetical protein Gohar_000991 [Gossypium harknessii]|uniref:RNase H type-1 domain-containing protein n=1 Tax=Gossypium harknessii TaxID=34285 RepID=A0A7J9I397_9ROSI|nr:hypothetical protein [Gossypium harknessii]
MKGNWIQLYTDGSVKMDVGITAVGEKGYQKVMIHADHLEVGKAIQDVHLAYSSSALLRRIHMSLQVIQHWKIKHITKERNQVADRIVKMATIRSTVMQVFEDISEDLLPALEIDRIANFLLC